MYVLNNGIWHVYTCTMYLCMVCTAIWYHGGWACGLVQIRFLVFAYIYIIRSITSIRLSTFLALLQQIKKECGISPHRLTDRAGGRSGPLTTRSITNLSRIISFKRGKMGRNLNFAGCYRAAPHLRNNRLPIVYWYLQQLIDWSQLFENLYPATDRQCMQARGRQPPTQECGKEQKVTFSANLAFLNSFVQLGFSNTNTVTW